MAGSGPSGQPTPIGQLRQASIWLIAAFGAVGAALATGISVSNLGAVHGWRFWLAVAGGLAAFVGVVLAIWHVGKVLEVHESTTADLRQSTALQGRLAQEPTFLGPYGHTTVDQLVDEYEGALADYGAAEKASWPNPDDTKAKQDLARAQQRFTALSQPVDFLRSVVRYEKARAAFRRARRWTLAGATLAFIGLIMFAYAANPPAPKRGPEFVDVDIGSRGPPGPPGPRGRRGPPGPNRCPGGTPSDPC